MIERDIEDRFYYIVQPQKRNPFNKHEKFVWNVA